ncbi:DNA repair protein RecO [Psychrosphaera sp. B3R10]|uniref:DNA repair protein RecO n=1 Tax=unclassified Psychrosphaera TaxID=2641570 RepID=UPI001C091944|nr:MULTISPECIES: DNA repair protein RecO [unclassified Psychrosphaera]MBU2882968.1 DNA repair protein RecO [Psychrosphaera sp. I2R16]MBU2991365.1 DNA repair protein RecO [Psychrosphaera sp. B3R10]MDO6720254.1 DNA repair protein RecO [Psychrosphaera sp. 1_MG-2023]
MTPDVEIKSAFILHSRSYKENQAIVEVLLEDEGRVSIVTYKGSKKNSQRSALLQPFRPLNVGIQGTSGLRKLKQIDADLEQSKHLLALKGKSLFCGFYLNEIICRLCASDAFFPELFSIYQSTLISLSKLDNTAAHFSVQMALLLRRFELQLLLQLGYGLNFETDMMTGDDIVFNDVYELFDASGFVLSNRSISAPDTFIGEDLSLMSSLLEIPFEDITIDQFRQHQPLFRQLKLIMQTCLHRHLGDKPLKSRELFRTA